MLKINSKVTDETNFYNGNDPAVLLKEYGSPLYVYSEAILRDRARRIKNLVSYPNFRANYAAKANTNLAFLQIVLEEGLDVDALSAGEIFLELSAGFKPSQILFVSNNVSDEEMLFAIEKGVMVSADSVAQLRRFGRLNPGGRVAVRFNPGVGAGHSDVVVTAGKNTKFGVNISDIPAVKAALKEFGLTLAGINQHIGSLFMDYDAYMKGSESLISIAREFPDVEFIDLGGGFGTPYRKQEGEPPMDLESLGERLSEFMAKFAKEIGKELLFKVEPGRFICAETGVLLSRVYSVKNNGEKKYAGTDLGFNVLLRPMFYDAHHEIEIYRESGVPSEKDEKINIVGNICESGDYIVHDRVLPEIFEDDIIAVLDAGAYGFAMSSNYNSRLRPAELLIRENGEVAVIRERDTLEDLLGKVRGIR